MKKSPKRCLTESCSQAVANQSDSLAATSVVYLSSIRRLAFHFAIVSTIWLLICAPIQADEGPNILLILTDDQGWPTLGCYGGKIVPTPNLDRLADDGARFTDAYVTSQCTPTRATLLTGQYTARHGLWHVLSWYGYPRARMTEPMFAENFPRETFTIAKGLRAAGYRTAIVGKWHLTSNEDGNYMGLRPSAAHHYGFDYAPPVLTKESFKMGADRGVDLLTDQTLEFIEANRDQPWFCFLSHHTIHGVVVAPKELEDKYREQGYGDEGPNRAVYLAGLEHIDRSIGHLMNRLDELGEAEETLILFLSDNGGIYERLEHRELPKPHPPAPKFETNLIEYSNSPLRAGKGSIYEGGVRVPMIAHWPGRIPKETVIETPVHGIDILPTCFAAAGATQPDDHVLDGCDLQRLLTTGSDPALANRPLYHYYPFYDLNWGLTPSASIRLGDYKLIEFFGDRVEADRQYIPGHSVELYNLADDIGESNNLVEANPDIVQKLTAQLHGWMDDLGAETSKPNPHFEQSEAFGVTKQKPSWLQDVK
ncbi:MAG: sulfatase [Verrucomicrobiota bacterium]